MSMNLAIVATREITVNKTGEKTKQSCSIYCWQTPTEVTYKIIAQDDPLQAYCDWVRIVSVDEEVPVYDDDTFLEEPIGFRTCNAGEEHIAYLQAEVKQLIEEGWEISYEVV